MRKSKDARKNGGNISRRSLPSQEVTHMLTSQTSFLSEILDGSQIPAGKRAYFQERLRNRLYDLIVTEFSRASEGCGFTQKKLANRLGKGADQINRWLSSPGNWTIDTLSDLLLGIAGAELEVSIAPLSERPKRNSHRPEWLMEKSNFSPAYSSVPISLTPARTSGQALSILNQTSSIIQTPPPIISKLVGALQ
jgi:transcriptional regulator with XRE-family HTH domain